MNDATAVPRLAAGAGARVHGTAEIGFGLKDGTTRLKHLFQRDPLRVLFPEPAGGDIPNAVVVTTSGGLVAGDRIDVTVRLETGAAAHVTGSAAEKLYRSTGAVTVIRQDLRAGPGAWLEFLPPEAILYDGARLRRETVVDVAPGAGFLGGGILVFGRRARGERYASGFLHEGWAVRRDGVLIWGDALHVDGDVAAIMADPACFAGAAACATLVFAAAAEDPRRFLDQARIVQEPAAGEGLQAGVTVVNGLLVARWLGADALSVRRGFADLACHLRQAGMGLPPQMPRLWHV